MHSHDGLGTAPQAVLTTSILTCPSTSGVLFNIIDNESLNSVASKVLSADGSEAKDEAITYILTAGAAMDSIFNFGALLKSPYAYAAREKQDAATIYNGKLRRWVAVTLGVAVALNIIILACAIVVVVSLPVSWSNDNNAAWVSDYSPTAARA